MSYLRGHHFCFGPFCSSLQPFWNHSNLHREALIVERLAFHEGVEKWNPLFTANMTKCLKNLTKGKSIEVPGRNVSQKMKFVFSRLLHLH